MEYIEMTLPGARLEGENPLPMFRDPRHDSDIATDGTLTEAQLRLAGYETGSRFLPYRMQDRYSRVHVPLACKAVVLENEYLKATFLPEYGGRLYSLYHKEMGRELLFKNPVLQPANLAILDAWMSGGIEWNIGQLGHTFTTCAPLFCAKMRDADGCEFLRMYEYERCHGVFWHLDFHLPPGSRTLNLYARIVNDNPYPVSMYWWTNIAVQEVPKLRIFSDSAEVIYLNMDTRQFGCADMPYLPTLGGKDASYPANFPYANEYFFQNTDTLRAPWEAAVYPDNWLFFERSSARLRYRKMFCWGMQTGGRNWKDFLSLPGQGNYVEIQGGLAPTQLHGMVMPSGTEWDFVQCFGGAETDTGVLYDEDWARARDKARQVIALAVSEDTIDALHARLSEYKESKPRDLFFSGSGFGALERCRRAAAGERDIPAGFEFPEQSMDERQAEWLRLLSEGALPVPDGDALPPSYMVGREWRALLEKSLTVQGGDHWYTYLHLGIMLLEEGHTARAAECFEKSNDRHPTFLAYRNLACIARREGDPRKAAEWYRKGFAVQWGAADMSFYAEYFRLLTELCEYREIWDIYSALPDALRLRQQLQRSVAKAALELSEYEYLESIFTVDFADIREGEAGLGEIWILYHARRIAEREGLTVTQALLERAEQEHPLPRRMDFRMK